MKSVIGGTKNSCQNECSKNNCMNNQKKLIVSATKKEVEHIIKLTDAKIVKESYYILYESEIVDILITGVGIVATSFSLTSILMQKNYLKAINIGIAGSYKPLIKLTDLCQVREDCFADLGVEDGEKFKDIFEINLENENKFPFERGKLICTDEISNKIKTVKAITVNQASGSKKTINKWIEKYSPDIETMEGAAFHFVCKQMNIANIQIRAISNFVEERNKSKWLINESILKLKDFSSNLLTNAV